MSALNNTEIAALSRTVKMGDAQMQAQVARLEIPTPELLALMNRALNTMEPELWPQWVKDFMGGHVENGRVVEGVRPDDLVTLHIERANGVDVQPALAMQH